MKKESKNIVKKTSALVLMSGGLDSMLAAKLLLNQGVKVYALCFKSNFFNCHNALGAAASLGVELKTIDISKEILSLLKNPPSGYGKYLNPCIDCHSLMIKKAGELANKENYDLIATGEVLGQRPFSQNQKALAKVGELSGQEVLRPLSAKLLQATTFEQTGKIDRGRLLNIRGRSRESQLQLARKYNLKDFGTPAGGCLLTDGVFSERLGRMLDFWDNCDTKDVELLKNGRVYWLKAKTEEKRLLMVVGRNEKENNNLINLKQKHDIIIELENIMGPTTLIKFKQKSFKIKHKSITIEVPQQLKQSTLQLGEEKSFDEIIDTACLLTGYYSTKARSRKVLCKIN
jgi:tRNA U34 2-thiouridine synthase MnmA/TrmU